MISRKILASTTAVAVAMSLAIAPASAADGGSADPFAGSTQLSSAMNTGSANLNGASTGIQTGSTNLQGLSSQGKDTAKQGSSNIKGLSSDDKDGEGDEGGLSPIIMIGGALVLLFILSKGGFSDKSGGGYQGNAAGESFSGSNGNK